MVNIQDVARKAGVGVSTVSRVINSSPDVKEETRRKIIEVIKELNYVPNTSAQVLKRVTTKNIGLFVKGIYNPFFSEMTNIISDAITKAGYTMSFQENNAKINEFEALVAFVKEKRLQGVLCLGGLFDDIHEENIRLLGIPVVFASVDQVLPESEYYSSIAIDNIKAAYEGTKYLLKCGHQKIACILGEQSTCDISYSRLQGYQSALEGAGILFEEKYILYGDYSYKGAYHATMDLLEERRDITAIFAISDIMAVGAAKAIVDSKLKIGEDISILGFDGMEMSKYYNPSISTIKQPQKLMAEESIALLFENLGGCISHRHQVLETILLERESVKQPTT